jgi:hypothetical protein
MKKLLLLPITLPLGMVRGAVEGALRTTADALLDVARGGDHVSYARDAATAMPPPARGGGQDEAAVVDLDIGAAAPRRRPASRAPRPAPAPSPARTRRPNPREVAEELGLAEGHVDEPVDLVESEGAAAPGPEIGVDEPWPGYGKMRAPDIVDRLRAADEATKAIVRLFEQQHRKRRTVLAATG